MIRIYEQHEKTMDRFHEKYAVQLNDTHPSLAVAELMRLLVDEHEMAWERRGKSPRARFGYTNHTLLPEALETWPLPLIQKLLPRHLEIIFEINRRFPRTRCVCATPATNERLARMSLIDERGERRVRMANLACVGSHAINGVAQLHSELLQRDRAARLRRALAGQVQQHDQRRHAAALLDAGQSRPVRAHHRG